MSMFYAFKPLKDQALQPLSRFLLVAGVTPNMVTAAGLALSVNAGLLAASGHLYAGIAAFLAGACLDALDGSLARAGDMSSEFGRYFDSVCDRLSELVFVAGAIIGGASLASLIVIGGSYLLLAARIHNHLKGLNSNAAPFSRPERLALLIAGLLAPAPYNLVLFATGGLLCLVSSSMIVALGLKSTRSKKRSQQAEAALQ